MYNPNYAYKAFDDAVGVPLQNRTYQSTARTFGTLGEALDDPNRLTQQQKQQKVQQALSTQFKIGAPTGTKLMQSGDPGSAGGPRSGGPDRAAQTAGIVGSIASLTSTIAAGTAAAAVAGPLAIAAFAVMAISAVNAHKKQKKAIKQAMQNEVNVVKTRNAMFLNRNRLEDIALNDTLNQVERQALKKRATFTVAKGETSAGSTYNVLQLALRRNELEFKERLKDKSIQKRIAMREHLVVKYQASRMKIQSLADQAPDQTDLVLGIIGDGLKAAGTYYNTVGVAPTPEQLASAQQEATDIVNQANQLNVEKI